MKTSITILTAALLIIFAFGESNVVSAQKLTVEESCGICSLSGDMRSPFRYLLVADNTELQRYVNRENNYSAIVLMEDEAFNEENLKILYCLLKNRYAEKSSIWINVFTDLRAIPTPEEFDRMNLYFNRPKDLVVKHAFLNTRAESITYTIPGSVDSKIVIVADPKSLPSKCDFKDPDKP